MTAAPRYATARSPERPTYGPAIGKLAAAQGTPLMPWQQLVADVAHELLPDGSWAYRLVIITVQRQAGKTTLLGPTNLHRAATRKRAKCWLTAQSRQDARDTMMDVVARVTGSPLAGLFDARRSNGSEGLTCAATGSTFRVFAPSEDALHGKANELVAVDEGWAFDAAQGAALEQAILPTFTTTGGQLWLVSTAGHGRSTWLREYVERGRAAVEAGRREGIAYFEWALDPEHASTVAEGVGPDVDPAARARAVELVLAAHPAAGITLRPDALVGAMDAMSPGEFLRAYGNVWTAAADRAIAAHLWAACSNTVPWTPPQPGLLALAFDVAADRRDGAIVAAWRDTDTGPVRLDVVDAHPGDSWLVPRLRELHARWRPQAIGYDQVGPALDVADQLQRGGIELRPTNAREYAAACAGFLSAVTNSQLVHRDQVALDEAVAAAATRPMGDGAWAWSRRSSSATIAPLVAATVAAWTYDHRPAPPVRPVVASSRSAAGRAAARARLAGRVSSPV